MTSSTGLSIRSPTFTPSPGLAPLSLSTVHNVQTATPSLATHDAPELFRRAEGLLGAFGQALTIAQDRRASATLDVLLTAQHEHLAVVVQGMADQRRDYGEALEDAMQRLVRDLSPESIMGVGETFRMSAGEITGALRRGEHMQARVLDVLTGIREQLAVLVRQATMTAASPAKVDDPRADKPALALVPPTRKAAPDSPLLHLDDE
jgi:hypothetical protein